jgi:hypothetical protein
MPDRRSLRQDGAEAPGDAPAALVAQSGSPAPADIIGARRVRTAVMISSGVDALEVDRRGAEIGVAELALDDVVRHALVRVRVAQQVWNEWASHPGAGGDPPELREDRGGA